MYRSLACLFFLTLSLQPVPADDTAEVQSMIDSARGAIRFEKKTYRLSETVVIDLDEVGFTSLSGDGVARFVMTGKGPAFRFVGTHEGTASPKSVKDNVWERQRSPMVDAIEIVGEHPEADGIEATGTMQLTLTRLNIRGVRHAVRLVKRNRNVTLSECHLYQNHGVGLFLDGVNLHQINVANCHISYNAGGGVVVKDSELRNLQINACDIEGNMGDADSEPTANVWLDGPGASIAEVAIVGCTIQHTHDAPQSANIRIDAKRTPLAFTKERRTGNITIADNILSDVRVNLDIRNARGVTISGNTMWKGYDANAVLRNCSQVVMSGNVYDRSPTYHYGDGKDAKLGIVLEDCTDSILQGELIHGSVKQDAALTLRRCRRMNVNGCSILDAGTTGLLLDEVSDSIVGNVLIRDSNGSSAPPIIQRDNHEVDVR